MKLTSAHKHILKLIARDKSDSGWTSVSELLFPQISKNMPTELCQFEKLEVGGRVKLTEEGKNVVESMAWL
jgi:hypothetical protein